MTPTIKYEMMILLTEDFNESELKTWAFNYAKSLRKLSASKISVISRGKRNLAYWIKNRKRSNYIQINFLSMPKYIDNFANNLKLDSHVLRFLILNKKSEMKNLT
uniref:Small ribosomal subunit protein bS6c n=1 Tax=Biddulphiella tridens TaxID=1003022 RepID=A0A2U9NT91_9STRA|nr:ribosomal protein S6 [Biddulphia tridens]AWT40252.1 ribosomal protein S6 [Biddulphia tridens]